MSAANHKYFFDEHTLALVRKVILLRSDFIGILSYLAHGYAIFLCSLNVEIYSLVGQLTMSNLYRTNSWRCDN